MSGAPTYDTLELDGLHVRRARPASGPGVPLLMVHGMWGGAWVWQPLMGYLACRGWDCHALDLRGHHGSCPVPDLGRVTLADYVDDVTTVAAALGAPVLLGHSMGGLLVQKVAERFDVAVVAITPAAPRGIFALRSLRLLGAAARHCPALLTDRPLLPSRRAMFRLALHRLPATERETIYQKFVPESGRQAREIALPGLAVDPTRVRGPMLVVGASDDRITPPAVVRRVARRYGAALYEYRGFGHMVLIEPGWPVMAGDVAAWLALCASRGTSRSLTRSA